MGIFGSMFGGLGNVGKHLGGAFSGAAGGALGGMADGVHKAGGGMLGGLGIGGGSHQPHNGGCFGPQDGSAPVATDDTIQSPFKGGDWGKF